MSNNTDPDNRVDPPNINTTVTPTYPRQELENTIQTISNHFDISTRQAKNPFSSIASINIQLRDADPQHNERHTFAVNVEAAVAAPRTVTEVAHPMEKGDQRPMSIGVTQAQTLEYLAMLMGSADSEDRRHIVQHVLDLNDRFTGTEKTLPTIPERSDTYIRDESPATDPSSRQKRCGENRESNQFLPIHRPMDYDSDFLENLIGDDISPRSFPSRHAPSGEPSDLDLSSQEVERGRGERQNQRESGTESQNQVLSGEAESKAESSDDEEVIENAKASIEMHERANSHGSEEEDRNAEQSGNAEAIRAGEGKQVAGADSGLWLLKTFEYG